MRAARSFMRQPVGNITLVGTPTTAQNTSTIAQPAGTQAGDVGVLAYGFGGALPAGWTAVSGIRVATRVYTGSEGSVTVTGGQAIVLAVFRGVNQATPVDGSVASVTTNSGTSLPTSAATAATYPTVLISYVHIFGGMAVSTQPTGTTLLGKALQTSGPAVGLAYAAGPTTVGGSSLANAWTAASSVGASSSTSQFLLRAA